MRARRTWAAALALGMVAALGVGCTSRQTFPVTDRQTGLTVMGEAGAVDGVIKTAEVTDPPPMPSPFTQVGPVTEVTGSLTDYLTLTLPIPEGVGDEAAEQLLVMRHDGTSWGAMPPQRIDLQERVVTITTREFSMWGLSSWSAEQAAAEFTAWLRNQTSSGSGIWLVGAIGRLVTNPPITECRHPAVTVQLDQERFVRDAILCPKYDDDDPERSTYLLHISNMQAYPVLLRLPAGVRAASVDPPPANPVSQMLVQVMGPRRGIAVLPGAAELILEVRADDLPEDATITGRMDFSGIVLDVGMAAVRTITGYDWNDRIIDAIGNTQEFLDYAGCVLDQGEQISARDDLAELTAIQLHGHIVKAATGCMSGELIARVVRDYAKANFTGPDNYAEMFGNWVEGQWKRAITMIENAHIITELAATIAEIKIGRTSYELGVTVDDPTLDSLHLALPQPGDGSFERGAEEPQTGGFAFYLNPLCPLARELQDWQLWTAEPGSAYGLYHHGGGRLAVSAVTAYVQPEHQAAVESLFTQLRGQPGRCDASEDLRDFERIEGPYPDKLTDYQVAELDWRQFDGSYTSAGFAAAYDPTKGLVVQITVTAMDKSVTPGAITPVLIDLFDYIVNKLDVSVGTSFTLQ